MSRPSTAGTTRRRSRICANATASPFLSCRTETRRSRVNTESHAGPPRSPLTRTAPLAARNSVRFGKPNRQRALQNRLPRERRSHELLDRCLSSHSPRRPSDQGTAPPAARRPRRFAGTVGLGPRHLRASLVGALRIPADAGDALDSLARRGRRAGGTGDPPSWIRVVRRAAPRRIVEPYDRDLPTRTRLRLPVPAVLAGIQSSRRRDLDRHRRLHRPSHLPVGQSFALT